MSIISHISRPRVQDAPPAELWEKTAIYNLENTVYIFWTYIFHMKLHMTLFAFVRYTGHKMRGYKLDCCFSSKDDFVMSCSEDGFVYCWDLVEVSIEKGLCTLFNITFICELLHLLSISLIIWSLGETFVRCMLMQTFLFIACPLSSCMWYIPLQSHCHIRGFIFLHIFFIYGWRHYPSFCSYFIWVRSSKVDFNRPVTLSVKESRSTSRDGTSNCNCSNMTGSLSWKWLWHRLSWGM